MNIENTIKGYIKQAVVITALAICGFSANAALGISGGGKVKAKNNMGIDFTPISVTNSFTLKGRLNYKGSQIMSEQRVPEVVAFNSVVTYQQGNTTYILPYKNVIPVAPSANNLQLLNFKVNIH